VYLRTVLAHEFTYMYSLAISMVSVARLFCMLDDDNGLPGSETLSERDKCLDGKHGLMPVETRPHSPARGIEALGAELGSQW
jgi:hypothetical protein